MAEDACKQGRFSIFTDNLEGIVPSFLQHCRGKIIGMNDQRGKCLLRSTWLHLFPRTNALCRAGASWIQILRSAYSRGFELESTHDTGGKAYVHPAAWPVQSTVVPLPHFQLAKHERILNYFSPGTIRVHVSPVARCQLQQRLFLAAHHLAHKLTGM